MRRFLKRAGFFLLLVTFVLSSCSGTTPRDLGCNDGRLSPCQAPPNCVSSQSSDKSHYIAPFTYKGSGSEAMTALLETLGKEANSKIKKVTDHYVHAEFTSRFFRFVDDVEFCLDKELRIIHVRSSSRVGYFDFGVNRRRIERLRTKLAALTSDSVAMPL